MRKLHTILTICTIVGSTLLYGQQDPMYSQYMFNTLPFNAGYTGSADVLSVMALSRHQWVGFDGAPKTQTLSIHSPLPNKSLSLGGNIFHDKIGPVTQSAAYVSFAYRLKISEKSKLALGISGGGSLFQAGLSDLNTVDVDPSNMNLSSQFMPNFGFGAFWHSERKYIGISVPKLLQNQIGVDGTVATTAEEERHYFLIAGLVKDITSDLKFRPSIMFRLVEGAPASLDMNAHFLLRNKIWFGAMYRLFNSFGISAQYQLSEQLKAGYAFDLTTNRLRAYNSGTHEIMIGYDLRFTQGKIVSPRYF